MRRKTSSILMAVTMSTKLNQIMAIIKTTKIMMMMEIIVTTVMIVTKTCKKMTE